MSDLIGLIEVKTLAETFIRNVFMGVSPVTREHRAKLIRPEPEDYTAVFGEHGPKVRERYEQGLWGSGILPEPKPGQTEVDVYVADPALLAGQNTASDRFPGGYREIADKLAPNTAWVCWRYHEPGTPNGMLYDGLVPRPGGRWAWFPKPWRVLGD